MYYGVIAFVLFITVFLMIIYRSVKNDRRKDLAVLVSIALSAVTEQFLFNLSFKNISLYFVGDFVYNNLLTGKEESTWNKRKAILRLKKEEICLRFDLVMRLVNSFRNIRLVKCFFIAMPIALISVVLFWYCGTDRIPFLLTEEFPIMRESIFWHRMTGNAQKKTVCS